MLTHRQIWAGVDRLAARSGLSPSGLAKAAGLDPTTFNKSKRASADGAKPRWPSTESLAKALKAAGASFEDFAALAAPLVGQAAAPERARAAYALALGAGVMRKSGASAEAVEGLRREARKLLGA